LTAAAYGALCLSREGSTRFPPKLAGTNLAPAKKKNNEGLDQHVTCNLVIQGDEGTSVTCIFYERWDTARPSTKRPCWDFFGHRHGSAQQPERREKSSESGEIRGVRPCLVAAVSCSHLDLHIDSMLVPTSPAFYPHPVRLHGSAAASDTKAVKTGARSPGRRKMSEDLENTPSPHKAGVQRHIVVPKPMKLWTALFPW